MLFEKRLLPDVVDYIALALDMKNRWNILASDSVLFLSTLFFLSELDSIVGWYEDTLLW